MEDSTPKEEHAFAWFWAYNTKCPEWEGPFLSYDLAVANARKTAYEAGTRGEVFLALGLLTKEDVYKSLPTVEEIVETTNDQAWDNGLCGEDALVSCDDPEKAAVALREWARQHLTVRHWYTVNERHAVCIEIVGDSNATN